MYTTQPEKILIGKFGSSFGIHGYIKVISFTEPKENIINYQPWLLKDKSDWRQVNYTEYKFHGNVILVKLPEFDTPEAVKVFTNKEIFMDETQLPKLDKNEFYWRDLEGLKVLNLKNEEFGIVHHVMNTGANDILVVQKDKQEHLIPFIKNVIIEVDLQKKIIIVDWELDY